MLINHLISELVSDFSVNIATRTVHTMQRIDLQQLVFVELSK